VRPAESALACPAHRTLDKQRQIRAQLAVRYTPVRTLAKYMSQIEALARREGCRIPNGYPEGFLTRVEILELPEPLVLDVTPLLAVMKTLNEQIKEADKKLAETINDDPVVNRFCSVPGVGSAMAVDVCGNSGCGKPVQRRQTSPRLPRPSVEGGQLRGETAAGEDHRRSPWRVTVGRVGCCCGRKSRRPRYALWRDGTRFDPEAVTGTGTAAGHLKTA